MMELSKAVALCESERKAAARGRRAPRSRILEVPGKNGKMLWFKVDGEPAVNLVWSSTDLERETILRTKPSVMDRACECVVRYPLSTTRRCDDYD
jgi:hypothetical protein